MSSGNLTLILSGLISLIGVVIAAMINGRHGEHESEISVAPDLADKLRQSYETIRELSMDNIQTHKQYLEQISKNRDQKKRYNENMAKVLEENRALKSENRRLKNTKENSDVKEKL